MKTKHYVFSIVLISLVFTTSIIIGWNMAKRSVENDKNLRDSLNETLHLAISEQPERFTELYFEDHSVLPNQIESGKEQSFKFTIHNLEHKDITYNYDIRAINSAGDIVLDYGSIYVTSGNFKTVEENYVLRAINETTKIQVTLTDQNQFIAFWLKKI